ncbi:hypothetical protein [Roseibium sp. MMSF_3544]|uniref:LIC10280 family protein n=1 Tax=unclassified Roseibium TaxID=2629323 RepID=UPI00273E052A|nr:hypothetical protein [Roseibium sp. MMSF_3544]
MKNPAKGCHAAHTTSVVLAFVVFAFATALVFKDAVQASPNAVLQQQIEGTYDSVGRNPDGSRYEGVARIEVRDGTVYMVWNIAGETFSGQGSRNGNTLVIDWGQQDPVIYTIEPDGTLQGTWAAGKAAETLRPRR